MGTPQFQGENEGRMMAEMSPGTVLRQLKQARAGMKKVRQLMAQTRHDPRLAETVQKAAWESLAQAHKIMAEVPLAAASEDVMTQQLALQRYATSLLVRIRRLARNEGLGPDEDENDLYDDDSDLD